MHLSAGESKEVWAPKRELRTLFLRFERKRERDKGVSQVTSLKKKKINFYYFRVSIRVCVHVCAGTCTGLEPDL